MSLSIQAFYHLIFNPYSGYKFIAYNGSFYKALISYVLLVFFYFRDFKYSVVISNFVLVPIIELLVLSFFIGIVIKVTSSTHYNISSNFKLLGMNVFYTNLLVFFSLRYIITYVYNYGYKFSLFNYGYNLNLFGSDHLLLALLLTGLFIFSASFFYRLFKVTFKLSSTINVLCTLIWLMGAIYINGMYYLGYYFQEAPMFLIHFSFK